MWSNRSGTTPTINNLSTWLGRPRVVEIRVHDGPPTDNAYERTNDGGIDFSVARFGCGGFSTVPLSLAQSIKQFDEVWVTTPVCQRILARMGVGADKIVVIPDAIDVDNYTPQGGWKLRLPHIFLAPRMRITGHRPYTAEEDEPRWDDFKFFAHFRWGPPSGWDVLLRAYFTAFTVEDRVSLIIKTRWARWAMPSDVGSETDGPSILRDVHDLAREMGYTTPEELRQLPRIDIVHDDIGTREIETLYRSTDAFVSSSRGDPYNMELAQAMAAGKPCIASTGSASDLYTPAGSVMAVTSRDVQMPHDVATGLGLPFGSWWREPSYDALTDALRRMVGMPDRDRHALGVRGRAHVLKHHAPDAIAKLVARRCKEIEARVRKDWRGGD
jgi:glycosyltransferase involved in cell wall biosynthesis